MSEFDEILRRDPKSNADKALCSAIALISTLHDPTNEARSFSHLTPQECFAKLANQWNSIQSQPMSNSRGGGSDAKD